MPHLPQSEIDAEITALKGQVKRVRELTAFGENNREAVEAQIEVLEEQLDEDEIEERAEENDWSEHVKDSALEAWRFWTGEEMEDGKPSENWEPLCG